MYVFIFCRYTLAKDVNIGKKTDKPVRSNKIPCFICSTLVTQTLPCYSHHRSEPVIGPLETCNQQCYCSPIAISNKNE